MNKKKILRTFESSNLINRPWLITQSALMDLVAENRSLGSGVHADDGDDDDASQSCPYAVTEDGIACIPITGPLTRAPYFRGTTYSQISVMCSHALNNSGVSSILLVVDSPGGEVSGCPETCDAIYAMRGQKPIAAISRDSCYSAAYWLASAADRVFVSQTAGVGSIGCWTAHADYSEMLKNEGVKVTYIFSGSKKVDGNPTQPLSDRARVALQEESDRIRAMFVAAVSRNRSVSAKELMDTEAGTYMYKKALPLLADETGTIDDALAYLRSRAVSVSPRSSRFTSSPATSSQSEIATLCASAFAPGANGCAEIQYSSEVSHKMFAKSGVTFALRTIPNCSATAPAAGSRRIKMLVAPYDSSVCALGGGLFERYEKGCFSAGLDRDPRALFNHDEAFVLGRKSAGTARFWEDAQGLHAEVDAPATQWANDLLVSLRRGDIRQSSAAFWIVQHRIEQRGGDRIRVVEKAILRDASPVAFAAYQNATASTSGSTAAGASVAVARARLKLLSL